MRKVILINFSFEEYRYKFTIYLHELRKSSDFFSKQEEVEDSCSSNEEVEVMVVVVICSSMVVEVMEMVAVGICSSMEVEEMTSLEEEEDICNNISNCLCLRALCQKKKKTIS